jgi:hypothetical protein
MFPIVNKSSLTIHQQQDTNTMSDPKLILFLTKQCEKITSLTIYSDKIESSHIEQVAATAIHLTSLCLIGSKKKDVPYINGLLSRIQSLTLDGPFIITELWATQMKRATHLTSLQISLLGMEIFVLEKLCRNIPQLTQLTLTDASSFTDRDVEIVTGFFPKLQSFVLQGSDHITEVALFHALSSCAQLQELKLRASISRREHPHQSLGRYGIPPDHIVIYLQTLVLENMMMDDDWFLVMSAKLKHLKNVGFKACPNLTDRAVAALLKQCKNITDLHVSECPRVSLRAFTTNTASLRRISLEHSGPSALADIHQLCITAKLFMLRVSATPQLEKSFLAEKINANNLLELNKQDMVDMANNTHPEHALTTSEDIVLTEHHVFQLAERLNVSLDVLTNILDDITGVSVVCSRERHMYLYLLFILLLLLLLEERNICWKQRIIR